MKKIIFLLFVLSFSFFLERVVNAHDTSLHWETWSDAVFERAKRENRLVLLDLEAVWCHWCHVMDKTTYQDPQVVSILQSHYLPVKVDQDARPDLANRYLDYGWPATVIFDGKGTEILKRQGYMEPAEMKKLLEAVVKDPSPESSSASITSASLNQNGLLSDSLKQELEKRHRESYDSEWGGLKGFQKFLDRESVEYALTLAQKGDKEEEKRARQTLHEARALLDPVWGGVYQYSTYGDWKHPHYEKLTVRQGDYLRIYALAYELFRDPVYLNAAQDLVRYLRNFQKSPDGAFYASQDADLNPGDKAQDYFARNDGERRRLGIPRIDQNIYSRENGTVIKALATLYTATGDRSFLDEAQGSARWVLTHRGLSEGWIQSVRWFLSHRAWPSGGFRHGDRDAAGPYLADNLAMADAFLNLYVATADRFWLKNAQDTARFIEKHFKGETGFLTAVSSSLGKNVGVTYDLTENIQAVRFYNLLFRYTGNEACLDLARHGMRYLSVPEVATGSLTEEGILMADRELSQEPVHITIVGSKADPQAFNLFQEALHYPVSYKRIEWWDPREGSPVRSDVQYPSLPRSAAFLCTQRTCSSPIYQPDQLLERAARLNSAPSSSS